MPKKGKGKKKSNLPEWMSDELKKVVQDVTQLAAFLSGPNNENPNPIVDKAQVSRNETLRAMCQRQGASQAAASLPSASSPPILLLALGCSSTGGQTGHRLGLGYAGRAHGPLLAPTGAASGRRGCPTPGPACAPRDSLLTPSPPDRSAQSAIYLRMLCHPTKMNAKKEDAIGQGAVEAAWKMVKDGTPNERTVAMGLLETLTRVESGRDALVALRPWPLLWNGVTNGSTALSADCLGVICNMITGWDAMVEVALDNKRALMKFLKELHWAPLTGLFTAYREMETCGGRTATLKAARLLADLVGPPPREEQGGGKVDKDNQERAIQIVLESKGLGRLVALARAQDLHLADQAARDSAVLALHHVLKNSGSDLHDEFISIGGVDAMVQVMRDLNHADPTLIPAPFMLPLITRARAAGCLRAIMKPDPERARAMGLARQEQLAHEAAARPQSAYSTLMPQEVYSRGGGRPGTAMASLGKSAGAHLGQLGPASILEAQLALMNSSLGVTGVGSPDRYNPYSREGMGSSRMAAPRPGTAGMGAPLGLGDIDVTPWGDVGGLGAFGDSFGGGGGDMDDTMQFETLLVDDATRAFAMERADVVAKAGAITPLVQLCCGPEGPLPDKENPPEGGAAPKKGKKKKKGKKVPAVPGTEEGQRYATGCLRVLALTKAYRDEMMAAGVLRYTAKLMMSKNHKARWHARTFLLALASDDENQEVFGLYEKKMALLQKKAVNWKTIDSVPQFVTMSNVPRKDLALSTVPEILYGKSHRLAQTAAEIKDMDAQRRFGKAAPRSSAIVS